MLTVSIIIIVVIFVFGLRIAEQYQRAVVFRLGRYRATRGPGLYWIIPLLEWQQMLDIRTMTADVERQEAITKDNVPVKINAVVWYRVFDPKSAGLWRCERSTMPSFKLPANSRSRCGSRIRSIRAAARMCPFSGDSHIAGSILLSSRSPTDRSPASRNG
jgi:regulator of protease activity HflC (stomatin/prohibitin superfamily)